LRERIAGVRAGRRHAYDGQHPRDEECRW